MEHDRPATTGLPVRQALAQMPISRLLIPALVFVATFAVLGPSLSCGFVDLDDARLITENQAFRGLSWQHLHWMFTAILLGHWQPLTWISYGIDYTIAGLDPWQFHLTSVLFHAANAVVLYLVIVRLVRAAAGERPGEATLLRLAAAAGTLLWSIHPLRVESVTWATERRDDLSGFFLLLAALAYLRAFPPDSARTASRAWYAGSVLLLAASLMCKAWGMSFFAIVFILDWYPLGRLPANPLHWLRRPWWAVLIQKLPYLVLGVASARLAGFAQNNSGAMRSLAEWPMPSRIAQAFYGLVFYLWKTAWPSNLCALYELRHGLNPWVAPYVACYILVLCGLVLVAALWKRAPWLAAATGAYAISVAPVLGLVQSGDQFVADRYSYIACMGWSALAAGGLLILLRRVAPHRRVWAFVAPLLATAILACLTVAQVQTWTDAVTLWRHAWQTDPTRVMPHVNYGLNVEVQAQELKRQRPAADVEPLYDEAIDHYRIAIALRPHEGRAWYPLGNALKRKHDAAGAEAAFRESAKYLPQAYIPLVNLGYLLEQDPNRRDEALDAFEQAVDSVEHPRPGSADSAKPYLALGLALKNRGNIDGARSVFTRALERGTKLGDTETIQQARLQLATLNTPK